MDIKKIRINSAEQAKEHSKQLENVWSKESYLTLKTLIYVAELLEKIERNTRKRKIRLYPKKRSAK